MKNRSALFLSCLLSTPTCAQIPSLFHTPQELSAAHKVRSLSPHALSSVPLSFHLSGLIYYGPQNWKLWINGKPYNKTHFPDLEIIHVTPHKVSFSLKHEGKLIAFTLAPNGRYTWDKT